MRYPQSSDCLLITFDAAHLKAHFGGVLYLFVQRNSDNKLSTLSFGVSNGERAADAARLVDLFRQCFPSLAIVVQDGGLALNSDAVLESLTGFCDGMVERAELLHIEARENVVLGTCARHLAAVLASKHKNKDVTNIVHRLAKARTQLAVDSALAKARAVSEGFYNDLEAAVDQLTLNYRLNLNLMSRDTTTQNNSESQNWSADDARCQGPVSLISTMLQRMIEKHGKLAREYSKSSKLVPGAVSKLLNEQIEKQQKYRIVVLHGATDTHIRANVAKKNGDTVLVEVFWPLDRTPADIRCPCRFWNDRGVICGRVAFLMLYVRTSLGLRRWDPRSRAFLHASLSMANLKTVYNTHAHFPSILPFSGDPSKILRDQMEEFGTLKCYPGDHKPRGKYDTVKRMKKRKKKDPKGRKKSWREKSGRKLSGGKFDEDNDQEGEDESDDSNEWGVPLDEIQDTLGAEGENLGAPGEFDMASGLPTASERAPRECQRCGGLEHDERTCNQVDITHLLERYQVFPRKELASRPNKQVFESEFDEIDFDSAGVSPLTFSPQYFPADLGLVPQNDFSGLFDGDFMEIDLPDAFGGELGVSFNSGSQQLPAPAPKRRNRSIQSVSKLPPEACDLMVAELATKTNDAAKLIIARVYETCQLKSPKICVTKAILAEYLRLIATYTPGKNAGWALRPEQSNAVEDGCSAVNEEESELEQLSDGQAANGSDESFGAPAPKSISAQSTDQVSTIVIESTKVVMICCRKTKGSIVMCPCGNASHMRCLERALHAHTKWQCPNCISEAGNRKLNRKPPDLPPVAAVCVGPVAPGALIRDWDPPKSGMSWAVQRKVIMEGKDVLVAARLKVEVCGEANNPSGIMCRLDCGLCMTFGCDGMCWSCYYRTVLNLNDPDATFAIEGYLLTPLAIIDHVATGDGLVHDDEINAMMSMLRRVVPERMALAETTDWVMIHSRAGNALNRFYVNARRRFKGCSRVLFPFSPAGSLHWYLVDVQVEGQCIYLYDSLNIPVDLKSFAEAMSAIFNVMEFRLERVSCGKQLQQTVHCGVFVVQHVKLLILGLEATEDNVPVPIHGRRRIMTLTQLMRSQMARELLARELEDGVVIANVKY